MSLANIQDNLVKNFMVQPFQSRGGEAQRVHEQVRAQFQAEQTRQADEVVTHTKEAEQQGIRPDQERGKEKRESKRRRPGEPEGEEEATTPPSTASVSGEGQRIDIIV